MKRKIPALACLLLLSTTALTACYDDRPGRNRPHDRDDRYDRHDGRGDRGDRGNGRGDRNDRNDRGDRDGRGDRNNDRRGPN